VTAAGAIAGQKAGRRGPTSNFAWPRGLGPPPAPDPGLSLCSIPGSGASSGAGRAWRSGRWNVGGGWNVLAVCQRDAGGRRKERISERDLEVPGWWRCSVGSPRGGACSGEHGVIGHALRGRGAGGLASRCESSSRSFHLTLPNLQLPRPASQPSDGLSAAVKGLRPDPLWGLTAALPSLPSRAGGGGHPGAE
jgi:hypothetical protein